MDAEVKVISTRRSRSTGTTVSVIDNRDGSFDAGDLPWFTLCEDHGGVCSHPTRRLAEHWAPVPDQWCPECQEGGRGNGNDRLRPGIDPRAVRRLAG